MTTTDKPGDPADKGLDAFVSHRAGYGDDKLSRVIDWLRKRPDMTLASGEGALLLAEIDRLRDDLHTQEPWVEWANREMDALRRANKDSADHYAEARAEIDRLRRILAALREPSEAVLTAVGRDEFMRLFTGEWETIPVGYNLTAAMIRAAVEAAEQEVGG